jgi:hypothetical protein
MTFREEYEAEYGPMRAAAVKVDGELLARLTRACQGNPWLRVGGIDFEDDPCAEHDYPYCLERYDDPDMLRRFFQHGNWAIRAAVQYRDLIFVNQVNGGDEWWTLKIDGDRLIPFESITFRPMCRPGGDFTAFLERLHRATPAQCKALDY